MPIYCKTPACARKKKHATYGAQGSRKKQWCSTCAKEHGGVRLTVRAAARGRERLGREF